MPTKPHGTILLNPPYDERIKMEDTNAFYKQIGDKLKKDFGGWTCWIISSNMEAIKSIGLPVYCYLSNLDYLIPEKKYGKRCSKLDASLSEEIESVKSFGIGDDKEGFGVDAGIFNDEDRGDYSIDLSNGELDDIPEKDRNIFIDIETYNMVNSQTIKNEDIFDRIMAQLMGCGIYGRVDIDYKNLKPKLGL